MIHVGAVLIGVMGLSYEKLQWVEFFTRAKVHGSGSEARNGFNFLLEESTWKCCFFSSPNSL